MSRRSMPSADALDATIPDRIARGSPTTYRSVLGMRVDASSYTHAATLMAAWADRGRSRYVCVASVNNVMQAYDRSTFMQVMNGADLVVPDGRPLVWALRAFGVGDASQVRGTYLTEALLRMAWERDLTVGVLGASPEVLSAFRREVDRSWPGLRLVYAFSPPFRQLSPEEDSSIVRDIRASRARILLVALGCPKQEMWMWRHREAIPSVMVGVGAAIDFLAGYKRQAPVIVQRSGLEWLFRLASEPRRLWRRYLSQNPRFVVLLATEVARFRAGRRLPGAARAR